MTGEPTVLIVEDQEELAEAYSTVIATEYSVRTATSGTEALEKIDEAVDVVILDRRMPGMSGDDVLAAFEKRGVNARVAMLTAVEPAEDILEMAIDTYVTKPIDNTDLLELVDTLFARADYDEPVQEFFSLAAKQTALEEADTQTAHAVEEIRTELDQLRSEIDSTLEEIPDELDPRTNRG